MIGGPGRIVDIAVRQSAAPLVEPFVTSRGQVTELAVVELELVTDAGHRGCGCAVPATRLTGETPGSIAAALAHLRPVLVGAQTDTWFALLRAVDGHLPGNHVAKAAVDLALHNLLAAAAGISMPQMLGAGRTPAVCTDVTVALDTPERMAVVARRRVAEGFTVLKVKVGAGGPEEDVARVLAVRDAAAQTRLRLDANQAWSAPDAIAVLDLLHSQGVDLEFVEQPVAARDLRGMAWVRWRCAYPVVADESVVLPADVLRVAEERAADVVNIKLAKHGGLLAAREVIAVATAAGLACMVGSMMETPGSVAASVALAATLPWQHAHDLDAGRWLYASPPVVLAYDPPNVRVVDLLP